MFEFFESIDFSYLHNIHDVNEMVDSFYELLYDAIDEFVPNASIRSNNKPIWYDNKLTNLKNVMNRQYRKLANKRKADCDADDSDFKKAQAEFNEYQQIRYNQHIKDIAESSKGDPKRFWKYINGKRNTNTIPNKLSYDGETVTEDFDKAKMFAKFFASVYINHGEDSDLDQFIKQRNDRGFFKVICSVGSILNVLQTMDLNKGASPDGISHFSKINGSWSISRSLENLTGYTDI